jgi:hypothetical protein
VRKDQGPGQAIALGRPGACDGKVLGQASIRCRRPSDPRSASRLGAWQRAAPSYRIPAPEAPLFEAASANSNPHSPVTVDTADETRGPLLLMTGGKEDTVPGAITHAECTKSRHSDAVTDLHESPDRAHSLTIDSGWREVADVALAWLARQSLARSATHSPVPTPRDTAVDPDGAEVVAAQK